MNEKAFIPLYLNSSMVDNLFTILVEEFSVTLKDSVREQIVLNVDTPLTELIKDRYIQGDIKLQVLNEYSRENTEQRRVKRISVFLQLMKILKQNNLIKSINKNNITNSKLNIGDYIQMDCELREDPLIEWFKDLKGTVNTLSYLDQNKADKLKQNDFIKQAENKLKTYSESNSTRLVTQNFNDLYFSFLIEDEFIEGNFANILEGPVTIIGKIINKNNTNNNVKTFTTDSGSRCNSYCNEFLKHMKVDSLKDKVNDMKNIYNNIEIPKDILEHASNKNVVNIIPLAIIF